ncbi:PhzF family phenazine biosynthesis protein [Lysinibacillus telephonicus]|uniref:PhzF family phenazine biosynthesis protein n=1 Tax=Lysinibacillus telephonicus TaxID=1714840 RepID=A0A3S0HLQ5_9BACI|nr:PhzF family phenazine biosynthesis protein [Lysinibacillus telephonicus]RTQ96482.1 PhzF family phenazine biosynthesis protein [Lysinibacillus telephonicus]
MKEYVYTLVDVFTNKRFGGNPLAVFENAEGLTTEMMQLIANELNLSETTFVFPPSVPNNTKKLRIFTPKLELPMAGHPTIGTAYVLATKGIVSTNDGSNEWVLEEGVGDIPVTVYKENNNIIKSEMEQPIAEFGETFTDIDLISQLLSLEKEEIAQTLPIISVSSGVPFLFIPIKSLAAMKKINFRTDVWQEHFNTHPNRQHIFTFTTETVEEVSQVHSRMFAPAMGIAEDPATGGASGPLGAYLIKYGVIPSNADGVYQIRSEQGFEMGRPSYIDITIHKSKNAIQKIKVGGPAIIIGTGKIYL